MKETNELSYGVLGAMVMLMIIVFTGHIPSPTNFFYIIVIMALVAIIIRMAGYLPKE